MTEEQNSTIRSEVKDAVKQGVYQGITEAVNREQRIRDLEWKVWCLQKMRNRLIAVIGVLGMAAAYTVVPKMLEALSGGG